MTEHPYMMAQNVDKIVGKGLESFAFQAKFIPTNTKLQSILCKCQSIPLHLSNNRTKLFYV
jgi:hypothetical protein